MGSARDEENQGRRRTDSPLGDNTVAKRSLAAARGWVVVGLGQQVSPGMGGQTSQLPQRARAPGWKLPPGPEYPRRPELWTRTHLGHTCPVVAQVEGSDETQKQKEELCPGAILGAQEGAQHTLLLSSDSQVLDWLQRLDFH